MHFRREAHVYIGVDLHKRFHVSAMVDSYGEPLGKPVTLENQPSG